MTTFIVISEMSYRYTVEETDSYREIHVKMGRDLTKEEKQEIIATHHRELREYFNFIIELN